MFTSARPCARHEHAHDQSHGHKHDHEHEHSHGHGRNYAANQAIDSGERPFRVGKEKAMAVFHARRRGGRENPRRARRTKVHFHEVGAVDSIVDIVGACVALEILGKPRVLASRPMDGTGWIDCAHGRFPIPAPATLEILAARGSRLDPMRGAAGIDHADGRGVAGGICRRVRPDEGSGRRHAIGFGLGSRDNPTRPNVLRAILGETQRRAGARLGDRHRRRPGNKPGRRQSGNPRTFRGNGDGGGRVGCDPRAAVR